MSNLIHHIHYFTPLLICYVLQEPHLYRLHCEDMIECALAEEDFKDRTMM